MKLSQIKSALNSGDAALTNLALSEFYANCVLANFIEWYQISGNADSPRKIDESITAGTQRAIGDSYTPKSNTPDFGAIILKIYGDEVKTDIAYERRGADIGSQRALDLANFAASFGRFFNDSVINDTLSATKFSGMKEQATNLSLKEVYNSVNGGSLPKGNDNTAKTAQQAFLEFMDARVATYQPHVIIANSLFTARLKTIGREYMTTTTVSDIYGANHLVDAYLNVPIINSGFKADKTSWVIPNNETEGTSSDCTSLYFCRFGEQKDITFATNVGLTAVDRGLVGQNYHTMVEIDADMAVLDKTALRRISGIRL